MEEKQRVYGETYPLDEDFLAALAHMPPASGCALGFDRRVVEEAEVVDGLVGGEAVQRLPSGHGSRV